MKSIMRRIDRFCLTHPRFGIPNLMLYIVIGNAVVWLFGAMDTTKLLEAMLRFSAEAVFTKGQIWRLITFVLVPEQSGIFVLIMLYFYYFIGNTLERQWGSGKFTIYYLSGILFNVLYGTLMWLITGKDVLLTASYINLSMFFSFATLYPETMVLLFFIIPVKIKWLAYINAAFFLWEIIASPFPVNLLPIVAILNYLMFCGGWLFDMIRPSRLHKKKKTIDFKKAAKQYNRAQAKVPYTRKCEVCGRTDRDYPNLEFRFCSKCGGYHCFCIDHINSHIHFKE
ncbi:MAG: rhomboid family intramembrane serine protease [Clostridiales bacterium]|nr:rhomboid family intramembrane serine protease [Clostridiales bacterium]